jgi:branched-chain amino acid transport system permease protein
MGITLIVDAFAVVVIGGLGSMRGAFVGALIVGVLKAMTVSIYAEMEMLIVYLIVIAVLVFRPAGLFAKATA